MAVAEPVGTRPVADVTPRKTPAINFFALMGALTLTFVAYVWIAWVAGPNFKAVPQGPSDLPGWMDTVQTIWQPAGILATLAILWFVLIKPWRREGRPTTDGVLVLAFCTLWFQDPLSAYNGHWFVYNTNLVNFGSWVSEVPGWNSFSQPGAMVPEPILIIGPVYVYFIIIATWIGCWVMRRVQERRPHLAKWQLIAAVFPVMCLVDVVGEAFVWLPLGFWEYPGGFGLLFPSTYHKYPINEMLTIASLFTAMVALRYFKDDKGMTLVERGADRIKSPRRQTLMRVFAVTFAAHAIVFVLYNLPNAWVAQHSPAWPADIQKRSYFTNGLCGEGTPRTCPGPNVPLERNRGSLLDPSQYAPVVPLDRGAPG
jgi:hypothetical protein